jgi:hypothetical protein
MRSSSKRSSSRVGCEVCRECRRVADRGDNVLHGDRLAEPADDEGQNAGMITAPLPCEVPHEDPAPGPMGAAFPRVPVGAKAPSAAS